MRFSELLEKAENHVRTSPTGMLTLGWRHRIWDAVLEKYPEDADRRWMLLAYLAVEETLPSLQSCTSIPVRHQDLPNRALDTIRQVIRDEISDKDAWRIYEHLFGIDLDEFLSDPSVMAMTENDLDGWFPMAGPAAVVAMRVCLERDMVPSHLEYSEGWNPYTMVDEDCDAETYDVHYFVMQNIRGLSPLPKLSLTTAKIADLARAFWLRWLQTLLPKVLIDSTKLDDRVAQLKAIGH